MQERHQVLRRWVSFSIVGVMGAGIQLFTLSALLNWSPVHYLPATVLAVEAALLHNFLWHERWTWSDRASGNVSGALSRLLRFNLTSGTLSMGGNLFLMALLVSGLHIHYLVVNLISITSCSLLNFLGCRPTRLQGCPTGDP